MTFDVFSCNSSTQQQKCLLETGNVFDCGYLSNPVNGEVDTSAGTTEGALAHYYCKTGYTIKGTRYRTCTSSGWSGRAPTCEGKLVMFCTNTKVHSYVLYIIPAAMLSAVADPPL